MRSLALRTVIAFSMLACACAYLLAPNPLLPQVTTTVDATRTCGLCPTDPEYPNYSAEICGEGFHWSCTLCTCVRNSPIIVDVEGDGFALTDVAHGVMFNFDGDGPEHMSWTVAGSDDAFLVLDRNGNGTIESGAELFGNLTPQPQSPEQNGFLALAEYDQPGNGGNGDGVIDARDSVFASLRLWRDVNHSGTSEANELHPLADLNVESLSLNYRESRRRDRWGNEFTYRAKVGGPGNAGRWAYDVFMLYGH